MYIYIYPLFLWTLQNLVLFQTKSTWDITFRDYFLFFLLTAQKPSSMFVFLQGFLTSIKNPISILLCKTIKHISGT